MKLPDGKLWWAQQAGHVCAGCGISDSNCRVVAMDRVDHYQPNGTYNPAYLCGQCLRDMLWGLTVAITYKPPSWAMSYSTLDYWRDTSVPDDALTPISRAVENCQRKLSDIVKLIDEHKLIKGKMIKDFKEDFDILIDIINLWRKTL